MGTFKIKIKTALTLLLLTMAVGVFAAPNWNWVKSTSNTTTIAGEIVINNYDAVYSALSKPVPPTVVAGDLIGAFVGNECRMVAEVFEYNGKLYISSVIHGPAPASTEDPIEDIEEVSFRLWDIDADVEIAYILGTEMSNPSTIDPDGIGGIGVPTPVLIGAPNTNSELESLVVTNVTISPAFSASTKEYDVLVASGSSLPSTADYLAEALDSRASVEVVEATAFDANGEAVTTITVKAEDGTETVYTITFIQDACATVKPIVANKTVCADGDLTLSVSNTANMTAVKWYTKSDLTDANPATGNSITATATATYYVTNTDGCESDATMVTITVNENPVVNLTAMNNVCQNSIANVTAPSGLTGGNGVWTTSPSGLISAGVLNTTTSQEVTITYTYTYANSQCSGSDSYKVNILPAPSAPGFVKDVEACQGAATIDALSVTSTNTVKWLNANGDTVATGTEYAVTTAGTYSAVAISNGCVSTETDVKLIINSLPQAPTVTAVDPICKGETFPSLSATGASIKWYNATGGVVTTTPNATGVYYATQTDAKSCESEKSAAASVEIVELSLPVVNVTVDEDVCNNEGVITLTPQNGGVFKIASSAVNSYDPANYPNGLTIEYILEETTNGVTCQASETFNVTVTNTAEPTVTPVSVLLNATNVPTLKANANGTITWYDANKNIIPSASGNEYNPGISTATESKTTFYVTNTENGCTSDFVSVQFVVSDCPHTQPTVGTINPICANETFPVITPTGITSGNDVNWYSDAALTQKITTSASYQPSVAGTYYVTQSDNTCESPSTTVTVTVNPLTQITINVPPYICATDPTVNLGDLFEPTGVTFPDFANGELNPAQESGLVTIDYTYTDNNSCTTTGSASTTIAPAIAAVEITAPVSECISVGTVNITATPANGTFTGENVTSSGVLTLSEAKDYTVTYTVKNDACTSTGSKTITVDAMPEAQISIASSGSINDAPFALTVSPVGGSFNTEVASLISGSGTDFEFNPTTANTYTIQYTVENGECSDVAEATIEVLDGACTVTSPTADNKVICSYQTGNVELTATSTGGYNANSIRWYASQNATTYTEGASYNVSATAATYYVAQYDAAQACESSRKPVSVTVANVDQVSLSSVNPSICSGDENPLITANAENPVYWTENATEPALPISGISSDTYKSTATSGTVTIWAVQQVGECQSEPVSVSYVINNPVSTPNVADKQACIGDVVTFAAGATANWYNEGVSIATNALEIQVTAEEAKTYNFTVEAVSNGCKSATDAFTLQVLNAPSISGLEDEQFIAPTVGPTLTITTDGTEIKWYRDDVEVVAFANQKTFTFTETSGVNSIIKVVAKNSAGCSAEASARIQISQCDLLAPELSTYSVVVCSGSSEEVTISNLGNNATVKWLLNGNDFSTNASITPTQAGTYTVTQSSNTCTSNSSTLTVQVGTPKDPQISLSAEEVSVNTSVVYFSVSPAGGQLTKTISDSWLEGIAPNYGFKASLAGVGEYQFTYSFPNDVCPSSITKTIKVVSEVTLDTTDLAAIIVSAENRITETSGSVGNAVGQYTQSAVSTLQQAIASANNTKLNATSQAEIDAAETTLTAAIEAYNNSKVKDIASGIEITSGAVTLEKGKTSTATVTISPAGLTTTPVVTWESSNESVATVNSNGVITAVGKGTANITVTINDGQGNTYNDVITVTVSDTPVSHVTYTDITLSDDGKTIVISLSGAVSIADADLAKVANDFQLKVGDYATGAKSVIVDPNDNTKLIVTSKLSFDGLDNIVVSYTDNGRIVGTTGNSTLASIAGVTIKVTTDVSTVVGLSIYPTSVESTINIGGASEVASYVLVNSLGQIVKKASVKDVEVIIIDVTDINEGIYTLNVYSQKSMLATEKIYKK